MKRIQKITHRKPVIFRRRVKQPDHVQRFEKRSCSPFIEFLTKVLERRRKPQIRFVFHHDSEQLVFLEPEADFFEILRNVVHARHLKRLHTPSFGHLLRPVPITTSKNSTNEQRTTGRRNKRTHDFHERLEHRTSTLRRANLTSQDAPRAETHLWLCSRNLPSSPGGRRASKRSETDSTTS